ncbi:hypothetical protein GWK16_19590 [Roseomonas sp. JC162]|uniref:Uncharacterized protein n=1 Tax=Neoroseomonas marina TaxID=1232220 RepID=A0A848EJ90_9PROT|nr:hypothetical protein [Neoroseomonas marina]NMJ43460.1 hypothetical protein [Neoroseomonas marina]
MPEPDGFYAGYFTSKVGQGFSLLLLTNGILAGVDVAGVTYDGSFQYDPVDGGYPFDVIIRAPANIHLVQGRETGPEGLTYGAKFSLPVDFLSRSYVTIPTAQGPVNARLVKLRDAP